MDQKTTMGAATILELTRTRCMITKTKFKHDSHPYICGGLPQKQCMESNKQQPDDKLTELRQISKIHNDEEITK